LKGYLFLNDATCPDGAQEYAVVKERTGGQVESITFSWCTYYRALELICEIVAGRYDNERFWILPSERIDTNPNHRCPACA
jgi:hypothetical protein